MFRKKLPPLQAKDRHSMKQLIRYFFFIAISISTLISCDMVEYHPYDLRVSGETGINAKNIAKIESTLVGRSEFSFAVVSDTQRWYDETEACVAAINARADIDFVLHTGDLSDFGARHEMEMQRDILNRLRVPYVCILGNHDSIATGEHVFNIIFGDNDFAFTAGDVRFVCLNTNALEFDRSEPVPNFSYIREQFENFPTNARRTVIAMHAGPFSEQFDNNTAMMFQYYVRRFPEPMFCLYGHNHQFAVDDFFGDGLLYYQCPCAKKRMFLVFKITDEGYEYETVDY